MNVQKIFLPIVGILILFVFQRTASNIWCLATGNGYFIPRESSIFSFHETRGSGGNGDWWMQGEDLKNYYSMEENSSRYIIFPKRMISLCPNFKVSDTQSWCRQYSTTGVSE